MADESVGPRPGDTVVFFTDGVTEAAGDGGLFGDDRLAAAPSFSRALCAQGVTDRIMQRVLDFQHGLARDDIALVTLKAL